MFIKIEFSSSSVWGATDPDYEGYDARKSEELFASDVREALLELYPGAEIEVVIGINDKISVDGMTDAHEVEKIQQLVQNTHEDSAWLAEKEYCSLQEITHKKSGHIRWPEGETWVGDWSAYSGIPMQRGEVTIVVPGTLTAHPMYVSDKTIEQMEEHKQTKWSELPPAGETFESWAVSCGSSCVVITICSSWD